MKNCSADDSDNTFEAPSLEAPQSILLIKANISENTSEFSAGQVIYVYNHLARHGITYAIGRKRRKGPWVEGNVPFRFLTNKRLKYVYDPILIKMVGETSSNPSPHRQLLEFILNFDPSDSSGSLTEARVDSVHQNQPRGKICSVNIEASEKQQEFQLNLRKRALNRLKEPLLPEQWGEQWVFSALIVGWQEIPQAAQERLQDILTQFPECLRYQIMPLLKSMKYLPDWAEILILSHAKTSEGREQIIANIRSSIRQNLIRRDLIVKLAHEIARYPEKAAIMVYRFALKYPSVFTPDEYDRLVSLFLDNPKIRNQAFSRIREGSLYASPGLLAKLADQLNLPKDIQELRAEVPHALQPQLDFQLLRSTKPKAVLISFLLHHPDALTQPLLNWLYQQQHDQQHQIQIAKTLARQELIGTQHFNAPLASPSSTVEERNKVR